MRGSSDVGQPQAPQAPRAPQAGTSYTVLLWQYGGSWLARPVAGRTKTCLSCLVLEIWSSDEMRKHGQERGERRGGRRPWKIELAVLVKLQDQ